MNTHDLIHIGCGAGFANDRPDAAAALADDLARRSGRCYLIFELLAERTLAEAQLRKLSDPDTGYAVRLFDFLEPVLDICLEAGIPIVTNGGAANPPAAARRLRRLVEASGRREVRLACVLGDDLSGHEPEERAPWLPSDVLPEQIVSANVYTSAEGITAALCAGADIVLCGRVADPSLVVGPVQHGLGWVADDWNRMAIATAAGHLLECCTQVTGGYFAHPGLKDVPDPAHLGCPIAEIAADGSLVITKTAGSGGCIDTRTVKEQLLYEIHDPRAYLTPDVTLDLGEVTVSQLDHDRVAVQGIRGHARPATLKGIVGLRGLWFGEAEISYAGPGAVVRAQLAREILKERCRRLAPGLEPWIDIVGVASVFNDATGAFLDSRLALGAEVEDVRVRLGVTGTDRALVEGLLTEVESLYTNGPAGGGGVRRSLAETIRTQAFPIARNAVPWTLEWY